MSDSRHADAAVAPYDLHLHTCWSFDGSSEPEAYFHAARDLGVQVIAITEHHHMDSIAEVMAAAQEFPEVRVVPAAEFTAATSLGNVDLLCYRLPIRPTGGLATVIERGLQRQRLMAEATLAGMRAVGVSVTEQQWLEALAHYRPARAIASQGLTRPRGEHLCDYLLSEGHLTDASEFPAFQKQLTQHISQPPFLPAEQVVQAVHEAGGLIALAHPHAYFDGADRHRMDTLRHECALDGIECAHPRVDPALTPIYRRYCDEHDLFSVAGSDSHSPEDIATGFARHGGDPQWLDGFLARLDA